MSIAKVNSFNTNDGGKSSFQIDWPSNTTACNLLTLTICYRNGSELPSPTISGLGWTWQSVKRTTNGSGAVLETFACGDATAAAGYLTVTFSASVESLTVIGAEWSGVGADVALNVLDQTADATGASGTPTAGSVTPGQDGELIYAVAASLYAQTVSPPGMTTGGAWQSDQFSEHDVAPTITMCDAWQSPANTNPVSDAWSLGNTSSGWLAQIITFVPLLTLLAGLGDTALPASLTDEGGGSYGSGQTPAPSWGAATDGSGGSSCVLNSNTDDDTADTGRLKASFSGVTFPAGAVLTGVLTECSANATASDGGMSEGNPTFVDGFVGAIAMYNPDGSGPYSFASGGFCSLLGKTQAEYESPWYLEIELTVSDMGPENTAITITIESVSATFYYYLPGGSSAGGGGSGILFRRTLSPVGTRIGSRQVRP